MRLKIKRFFLTFCFASLANAETNSCSLVLSREAEQVVSNVNSWNGLFLSYEKYNVCDDGSIAEAFSEVTTNLLVKNWAQVEKNDEMFANDLFFKFVLRHIDESVPEVRLKKIGENIRECSRYENKFCKAIAARLSELTIDTY